jgi:branched-chain amino acid transport system substrate-binding protein
MGNLFRTNCTLFLFLHLWISPGQAAFAEPQLKKELKVGAVLALTGDAAVHSASIRRGIELAAAELKAQGWILDISFQDDQTQPAKTITALHQLHSQGYKIFIGPTWSFQVKAARPFLEKSGSVALVPGGSSEINGGASEAIFNLCPSYWKQEPVVRNWLLSTNFKRVFIYTPHGDWGVIHKEIFKKAVLGANREIVGEDEFDYGEDVAVINSVLLKARSLQADLLVMTAAAREAQLAVISRQNQKVPLTILGTNEVKIALAQKLISSELTHDLYYSARKMQPDFAEQYQQFYHQPPELYADSGYDALMLLAKAKENNHSTADEVRNFLRNVDYTGQSGRLKFDERGDIAQGTFEVSSADKDSVREKESGL